MHIEKEFHSLKAKKLIARNPLAKEAYDEIKEAISAMTRAINNAAKKSNGVSLLKEPFYQALETKGWSREKPLEILSVKGGPIDVFKSFSNSFNVGIEVETGNAASSHRSLNKLLLGICNGELDLAILMMPIHQLSVYLTDRVSNYEEISPYLRLVEQDPFIVIGFDVEEYSSDVPCLPKGTDGNSKRSVKV